MRSRFFANTLVVATFATCLIGISHPAAAISGADWQAGRIIDDTVFNFAGDMSVEQIQAFLNSKVPTCDTQGTQTSEFGGGTRAQYGTARGFPPPYVCLKDYYENETTHENNLQGRPIPAGAVSAARMIYDAAQANSINPKVLIVTLQKESSGPLVTDTWPFYTQYRTPMGYACPDTAPCDAQYYGFYNQMSSAAWQFRRYADFPANYRYKAGQNNDIHFSPSTSCGSSTVFIQNQATASLYNYTPYQPNPAALAGMNDSTAGGTATCGAYGNRNFFWYYNKWFGSTRRTLVTTAGSGVSQVENGARRAFPNEVTFLSYSYKWSDVLSISNAEFNAMPDGADMPYNVHFRDGHLVTSPSGGMYVVNSGLKRVFPNEGTFFSYGYQYSDALVITNTEVNLIPDGTPISYNVHLRDGHLVSSPTGIYVVENGTRRPFPNEITLFSNGYKYSDALVISSAEMGLIPDGVAEPYNVHFRDGHLITSPTRGVYQVENGTKRAFPSEIAFLSYSYKWPDVLSVTNTEVNLIPDGTAMSYNVHFRDGHLVTSAGGGVYVIDNGLKRPFPNEATFFSYGYKYSDALVISSAEIPLIPDGTAMPPKQ